MHLAPLLVLLAWIPLGAYLFHRFPARVAILANFLAGWAVLPGAPYAPTNDVFPIWILGVCLPTVYPLTKATATGLAALIGVLLFHRAELRELRPWVGDLPMAVWCMTPIFSSVANGGALSGGLFGAAYLALAWGAPWLLGRIWFSDDDSLLMAAKAIAAAGLCYAPICLVEVCTGPQLYALLYGYQPYRWVGAERYLGYRPIGLLEDGNQLGIWMAASTLVAVFLWVRTPVRRLLGLRMRWVAMGLGAVTLLCQSVGSIALLLLLLPLTLVRRRSVLRASFAVLVLGIVAFALFRLSGVVSLRELAQRNGVVHSIASALTRIGRNSLGWRLAREETHMRLALERPLFGLGAWNWWQNGDSRPWGLWLLVFGMYGAVGLAAMESMLIAPVLRAIRPPAQPSESRESGLRLALAALILMVAFDNLLNGAMILPFLAVVGGLSGGTRPAEGGAPDELRIPALPEPEDEVCGDESAPERRRRSSSTARR